MFSLILFFFSFLFEIILLTFSYKKSFESCQKVTPESYVKKDNVKNEEDANITHYTVGKAVRKTIKNIGGTMPEKLPTPNKSIKQIEKEEKKKLISQK